MTPTVIGARGPVADSKVAVRTAQEWAAAHGGEVQLFDADFVLGPAHLLVAAERAERAFAAGTAAGTSTAVEALLYASGERQIGQALRKMGVKDGGDRVAILGWRIASEELLPTLHLTRDDSVLAFDEPKLRRFGFTDLELQTVPGRLWEDLVLERVALVEIAKR